MSSTQKQFCIPISGTLAVTKIKEFQITKIQATSVRRVTFYATFKFYELICLLNEENNIIK